MTITATDNYGQSSPVSFTWTITNTVSVTNPGDAVERLGHGHRAALHHGLGLVVDGHFHLLGRRNPAAGPGHRLLRGTITGTPTTAGTYPVTITVTDDAGYSGSATFTWTITNTVSVTGPGDQSDVSGTAITPVPVTASDSSSTATLTYSDGGTLPPGLSIDPSSGVISGTPTTGGSYAVTITATDDAGFAGSETFTWVITNTITVTSPGDQSDVSGTAITPLADHRHRLVVDGHPHLLGRRHPAAGLSIDPSRGSITGTPTTAGTYSVTITATDGSGASGSATFTWTVTNTVTVTSPGDQFDASGTAISPCRSRRRTRPRPPPCPTPTAAPCHPGSPSTPPRGHQRHPDHRRHLPGDHHGHRRLGGERLGQLHLDHPQHRHRGPGAEPDQRHRRARSPRSSARPPTPRRRHPSRVLAWTATGLPPGLSIEPATGNITGTPTAAGTYSVTVTATERAMPSDLGSTSFTWTVVNVAPTITSVSPQQRPRWWRDQGEDQRHALPPRDRGDLRVGARPSASR